MPGALMAVVRRVSPTIGACELTHIQRTPIDVSLADRQHERYSAAMREAGAQVVVLDALPDFPDAVFVEDPAVVLDEAAVLCSMGKASRAGEVRLLEPVLARYRPVEWIGPTGTLEGGDVLPIGRTIYVGLSSRTDRNGIARLDAIARRHGYRVRAVELRGCLHLKSACTFAGDDTVVLNPAWVDAATFEGMQTIAVAPGEDRGANVIRIGRSVLVAACFPRTNERIAERGFSPLPLDISELQKAESGLTCSSLIFSM